MSVVSSVLLFDNILTFIEDEQGIPVVCRKHLPMFSDMSAFTA